MKKVKKVVSPLESFKKEANNEYEKRLREIFDLKTEKQYNTVKNLIEAKKKMYIKCPFGTTHQHIWNQSFWNDTWYCVLCGLIRDKS